MSEGRNVGEEGRTERTWGRWGVAVERRRERGRWGGAVEKGRERGRWRREH